MKKLVVVTNLLPHYQIDFFNRLVEVDRSIELTVFADIYCDSMLNNYDEKNCNFDVIHSSVRNLAGFIFRKTIRKKINEIDPDFLIFYGNPREISLSLLMLYFRLTRRCFYVHGMFHRVGGQTIFSRIYYRFVGLVSNKCFTYSKKGADVLINLGVDYNKIKIIGTAIDEKKSFDFSSRITDEKLIDFKIYNNILDKKVVLQVVRLSKIKKPDVVIDIAQRLSALRSDFVFVLIGGGEMYEEIKEKIRSLELNDFIFLLGPIYDETVLSYWFKSSRMFFMPTCIGLSAHHAFSYSLPIITDDSLLDQASEFDIIAHGLNSITYKAGDLNSLESSILSVLDNDSLHCFLSKNALYTVKNISSLDNKCRNYIDNL